MARSDSGRLSHPRALDQDSCSTRRDWSGLADLIYRCFLGLFLSALIVFFAIVFYNTLFGVQTQSSTEYSYPYPVSRK